MSDKQKQIDQNYLKLTSIAGMLSGGLGRIICHPIDTVKAKLYVNRMRIDGFQRNQLTNIIKLTFQQEGIKGFYRGITINAIGAAPAFSLYITSYEYFKSQLSVYGYPSLSHLGGGFLAEVISCVLWLPIDIVKERMQVQKNLEIYKYEGSVNAVKQIIQQEGILGIYRGYGATLVSFGTYSALYFMTYEKFKEKICKNIGTPKMWESILSSSAAFLISSFISNPLSISKLRLQVQRVKGIHSENKNANFGYQNIFHGVYLIYKNEGVLAFYKGYSARIMYGGSISSITMSLAEFFRNQLKSVYNKD